MTPLGNSKFKIQKKEKEIILNCLIKDTSPCKKTWKKKAQSNIAQHKFGRCSSIEK